MRPRKEKFVMAHELQIRNTQERVKVRNPWAVALLPIITLGIYHLVWWYRINREMRDYGRAKGYDLGQNPTASLLALFPGGIIIVPALITYWRGTKRVQGAARIAGQEPPSGWIALILYLLIALGFYAYLQVILVGLRGMRIEEGARLIVAGLDRVSGDLERFRETFELVGKHLNNASRQHESAFHQLERLEGGFESLRALSPAPPSLPASSSGDDLSPLSGSALSSDSSDDAHRTER